MTTYVHYGSDHFIPAAFIPVRNAGWMEGGWRPKPADGTGLWASRVNDEWGWEAWCRGANFNIDRLRHSFRFTLPDANILELNEPDQLLDLPKLHPWEPKRVVWLETIKPGEIPTMEQLQELYMPNWCYLDFEKLAEAYDAIELRNSHLFRSSLSTWDCDCILVLKADKVVEMDFINAQRFLEVEYQEYLKDLDAYRGGQDSEKYISPKYDPETGNELPF